MTEWPTKEIENDRIIVYCAEGEYELVDTAKARFQMLDVEERRDALSRAKRFARPGESVCIDSRCFLT